jgi:hypothetical protein
MVMMLATPAGTAQGTARDQEIGAGPRSLADDESTGMCARTKVQH